jgi:hypothetical protein
VVTPLSVEVGLKLPHTDAGVQLQVMPALLGSFATVAAIFVLLSISADVGGVGIATVIVDAIPIVAVAVALESADAAVMVTLAPGGTDVGAV